MKKILLIITILLLPVLTFAQRIDYEGPDTSGRGSLMYTSWTKANWAGIGHQLQLRMQLHNDTRSLILNWVTNDQLGVNKDAKITLFFQDLSKVTLTNQKYTETTRGAVETKDVSAAMSGITMNCVGNFHMLNKKKLKIIRISTTKGLVDINVTPEESAIISRQYAVFKTSLIKILRAR